MSPQKHPTFAKRQKEQARQEKQRAKAERKQQRKLESRALAEHAETGEPLPPEETSPAQAESSLHSLPVLERNL